MLCSACGASNTFQLILHAHRFWTADTDVVRLSWRGGGGCVCVLCWAHACCSHSRLHWIVCISVERTRSCVLRIGITLEWRQQHQVDRAVLPVLQPEVIVSSLNRVVFVLNTSDRLFVCV